MPPCKPSPNSTTKPKTLNPIRARILRERDEHMARGIDAKEARLRAGWRVFSTKPGAYGAGLQELIDAKQWQNDADLCERVSRARAAMRTRKAATAWTRATPSARASRVSTSCCRTRTTASTTCSIRTTITSSRAAWSRRCGICRARNRRRINADHSNPAAPRIRTLNEEISRVIRSRVVNPKWIDGVKRHGYKGASELAATVDYLFGYDATARVVSDHQYALVTDAYVNDADTREFMQRHNPHALHSICERLTEAMQRGLWQTPGDYRAQVERHLLNAEQQLEGQ